MSVTAARYDAVVIGAGPAGEVVAGRLADHGRSVAIIERELVGGECAFYACMPSKALLRPGELLAEVRRVPGVAEALSGALDVEAVLRRRDEVVQDLDDEGHLPWLQKRGITLVRGHGRLNGERSVVVGEHWLTARDAVVIATGSAAAIPDVPGLADAHPWTNREATTAKRVPARLLILGGGVVGVEMADAYASLGASLTLVEPLERLISREEDFASEQLADALRAAGVDVRLGVKATSVQRDGTVRAELDDGSTVEADEILVATGRRPLSDDLGLDSVGLEGGSVVEVDDQMRAGGLPWLYAVGDVNGRALLTHVAKYQARVLADVILGDENARVLHDDSTAPRAIFTDPQVAAVGLTLAAARERGLDARAYDVETSTTPGASFYGRDTAGTSRLVVDAARRVVVGATFTGTEVVEWLHAATIAVTAEVPLERFRHAVPVFPARSEVWLKLLERLEADGIV
jgi:dihydrolipoamide dehydrogenase